MNLSYSKISRYMGCPRNYHLYYNEGWRTKKDSANLVFGSVLHNAIQLCLMEGKDPVLVFVEGWAEKKDADIDYNSKQSWESLLAIGQGLMQLFVAEHLPRFINVYSAEQSLSFPVGNHTCWGFSDLLADVITDDGEIVTALLDFKTAASDYNPVMVQLNDQLTVYNYASRGLQHKPDRVGYLVFIKTKTPKITWHWGTRTPEDEQEYLVKASWAAEQMLMGNFPKHPGQSCGWCDFAPLCLKDETLIAEQLKKVEKLPATSEEAEEAVSVA